MPVAVAFEATPRTHAPTHAALGSDPVTPAAIGAAAADALPNPHAATHATNGADPVTPAAIGAAPASAGIPSGAILLWSGSIANIPAGWALCDGTNGTPDLRDRFVVGAGGGYAVGAIGGANTVVPVGTVGSTTLTLSQIPPHSHQVNARYADLVTSRFGIQGGDSNPVDLFVDSSSVGGGQSHTHSFTGTAQENRPPYYALAYIMKL